MSKKKREWLVFRTHPSNQSVFSKQRLWYVWDLEQDKGFFAAPRQALPSFYNELMDRFELQPNDVRVRRIQGFSRPSEVVMTIASIRREKEKK